MGRRITAAHAVGFLFCLGLLSWWLVIVMDESWISTHIPDWVNIALWGLGAFVLIAGVLVGLVKAIHIIWGWVYGKNPWGMSFLVWDTLDDRGQGEWLPYLSLPVGTSRVSIQITPYDKRIDLSGFNPRLTLTLMTSRWEYIWFRLRRLACGESAIYRYHRATLMHIRLFLRGLGGSSGRTKPCTDTEEPISLANPVVYGTFTPDGAKVEFLSHLHCTWIFTCIPPANKGNAECYVLRGRHTHLTFDMVVTTSLSKSTVSPSKPSPNDNHPLLWEGVIWFTAECETEQYQIPGKVEVFPSRSTPHAETKQSV